VWAYIQAAAAIVSFIFSFLHFSRSKTIAVVCQDKIKVLFLGKLIDFSWSSHI
jgi:hypothetical protein